MADYVANGTENDDILQNPSWTTNDTVTSNMYEGNDIYIGWGAFYSVRCGAGNDQVTSGFMGGTAWGGTGDDRFNMQSTGHTNTAYGQDNDDWFHTWFSLGGANNCYGGSGVDSFQDYSSGSADLFDGAAGFDYAEDGLSTSGITVSLAAGTGAGGNAAGNQYISIEGLTGSAHGDSLTGSSAGNVLVGANGADTLDGAGGDDLLIGNSFGVAFFRNFTNTRGGTGANPYSITDSAAMNSSASVDDGAADILIGGKGDDVLIGGKGADTLNGGSNTDTASYVDASSGVTVNLATGATDGDSAIGDVFISIENLIGSGFDDVLSGHAGANRMRGQGGQDTLGGAAGSDTLLGEDGNDTLNGGRGIDTLVGGDGFDRFVFDVTLDIANADIVSDFAIGTDKIVLDNAVFRKLTVAGALDVAAFSIGPAAADTDTRIFYNDVTGELFYDRDGTGSAVAELFATLQPGLTGLLASDFEIV